MLTKFSLRDYNFKLLLLVICAITTGVVVVNSADSSYTKTHIIGAFAALFIMLFVSLIDYHFVCKFYVAIYIVDIIILLMVLLFGVNVNHAKRWINFGGYVQFQPSEFAKIIMVIFMAVFLAKFKEKDKINSLMCIFTFALFAAIPLVLIIAEPDLSTTICLTLVLLTMLYVSGLSYKIIGIAALVLVPLAGSFLWYIQQPKHPPFKDYQVMRVLQFIYPEQYGVEGSQQSNSIMAIGSGMLNGKGLYSSTIAKVKDANFISEQQTDFIFSVIGEELGFVGSVLIIAIILLIVLQCIKVGRYALDTRGTLLATGIGSLIAYQSFINIGVATGVIPNTGIPLPFISYGLSSLLSISAGVGIVLNVSLQRSKY